MSKFPKKKMTPLTEEELNAVTNHYLTYHKKKTNKLNHQFTKKYSVIYSLSINDNL